MSFKVLIIIFFLIPDNVPYTRVVSSVISGFFHFIRLIIYFQVKQCKVML